MTEESHYLERPNSIEEDITDFREFKDDFSMKEITDHWPKVADLNLDVWRFSLFPIMTYTPLHTYSGTGMGISFFDANEIVTVPVNYPFPKGGSVRFGTRGAVENYLTPEVKLYFSTPGKYIARFYISLPGIGESTFHLLESQKVVRKTLKGPKGFNILSIPFEGSESNVIRLIQGYPGLLDKPEWVFYKVEICRAFVSPFDS
jgi:hypothetical protein